MRSPGRIREATPDSTEGCTDCLRELKAKIAEGRTVTSDLGGNAGTSQFADAVIDRLGAGAPAGAAA